MAITTQAIETRYLGPTNTKEGRIKATARAGSVTLPYDHALSAEKNHKKAAFALLLKLRWNGTYAQGGNVNGTGYYFVNVEGANA
jgi:hypothetical protein